jgi:predicted component of type VI protein secretion system
LLPPVKLKTKGLTIPVFAQVLTKPVTIGGPGLQDSDIELEGSEVPPRACALEMTPEGLDWVNLGRCPCTVNGLPLPGRIRLAGGERIVVGDTAIDVELAESIARAPEASPVNPGQLRHRYRVEVVRGPDRGRQAFLDNPRLLIGRLDECQLRVSDPTVSRRHCLVVHWEGAYHLRSLGSKPALINGVPAHDRELKHDDRIQVGDETELRFVDGTR